MGSAISIGTTGLTAASKQIDVIGNNLANSSTLGFKSGSTYFASMLNQSLSSSGSMAVGQGVSLAAVNTLFTQGSFESTGNATDLAIDGDGFFMVEDTEGALYYTRAGAFHINSEGYLVDNSDYHVQGYNFFAYDSTAVMDTDTVEEQADITLKNVQSSPKATTTISIGINLDESAGYGESFNVSQTVYDSKGGQHDLSITFLKTEGSGTWGFNAKIDDLISQTGNQLACGIVFDASGQVSSMYKGDISNITATTAGTGAIDNAKTVINKPGQLFQDSTASFTLTKGTVSGVWDVTADGGYTHATAWQESSDGVEYLKMDLDGTGGADITFTLDDVWAAGDTVAFDITKTDMAAEDLGLSFGTLDNGATIGVSEDTGTTIENRITWDLVGDTALTITGYASTSVVKSLSNDGYTSGVLKSLGIANDGVISGTFTNGQTSNLGQILMADFPNSAGLKKIGNYFGETSESGAAIKNKPGSGGLGEIVSNSLETSNVDVAKEFVNMITAQRAYQANAKVITAADEMLSILMNIKQ